MCSHRHLILHLPAKFRSNWTIAGRVKSIFQDGGHEVGSVLPGAGLVMASEKVEVYLHAKFLSESTAEIKLLNGFEKKYGRHAAILELHFRFGFRGMCSYCHHILHLPAKFRSNQTIGVGVMTSYRFFKMAAIGTEISFRMHLVAVYLHAKFR